MFKLDYVKKVLVASIVFILFPGSVFATATTLEDLGIFNGEETSDAVGSRVANVGDVNADGYEDVVVAATSNGENNVGAVYLIYGRDRRYADNNLGDDNTNFVKFYGSTNDDRLGSSVSGAGDINGDGYSDFIIGAKYQNGKGIDSGAAYIIYGKADKYVDTEVSVFPKYFGDGARNFIAESVSGGGDVNGDGYDDLLIGAPYVSSRRGSAYLIYGSATELSGGNVNEAVEFSGESKYNYAGQSVAFAGDINGDGYDDMLVGAYRNSTSGSKAGAVYIIYGKAESFVNQSLADAVKITGETSGDNLGSAVSTAGDVNNDGYDDFLLGAHLNDYSGHSAGSAYLFYGQAASYTATSASDGVRFYGHREDDYVGFSFAPIGNANNDEYDDFIIGAPSNHSLRGGNAYIIYGQAEALTDKKISNAEGFEGEVRQDRAGISVAGADLNGDGQSDLLIGARNYGGFKEGAGALYVGYLPIHNCENSVALGGILADYPTSDYKLRKYKKNKRLRIVVERRGRQAFLVNCKTDKIIQTLNFNDTAQRKILARVFSKWNKPLFVAVTRTRNKRNIKIYLYQQKKKKLVQTDYLKRKWRPRGLRLKLNRRHQIVLEKGAEKKHTVKYSVNGELKLHLETDN
ncbi:MAG: FG-GAP-like repeat-containing protein [bacterium]|nr:FG-GAP-like repeat-containing protein [bacterium]